MNKARGLLAVLIAGAIMLAGEVVPAAAQSAGKANGQGNGLKIAPVRSDLTIEKGSNRTVTITVENITASPINLRGITNDFVPSDDESGEPRIILDEKQSAPGNSFKSIVGPLSSLRLLPNERKEVRVTLSVPDKAASGGYYGAVRFVPGDSENDKNVALTASVGTIFLVRVPGQISEKLSVESLGVSHEGRSASLFNSGPVTIDTRFRNFGNVHVQPFGKIFVKNFSGKIIAEMELNNVQPRGSVLPNSVRKFNNPVKAEGLFGRYTVEGSFGYGSNGELLLAKKTFYVIPFKLIGTIAVILLFLVFGLPRLIRAYNQRIIQNAQPKRPARPTRATSKPPRSRKE
ncbi:MAG TPA: hypothetical protein VK983_01195 [Candidatus Limnocylindrales bacterium]|nr:hypothetical protein [Candidatus Limnocylindrales bacterium]